MAVRQDSVSFQFMLKEYEMLYGKFQMHYEAVEKTINFYFILIGAVVSLSSLLGTKDTALEVFKFNGFQMLLIVIFAILGTQVFFKVVEHRLLLIAYVKSLNLNRKWFLDNADVTNLDKYLYWKATPLNPVFYRKHRHFYWETISLASINGFITSLLLINLTIKLDLFFSEFALRLNVVFLIVIGVGFTLLQMFYYTNRAKREQKALEARFSSGEILS